MQTHNIIIRPIVTEKSMAGVGAGRYIFAVSKYANKTAIKKALHDAFNVNVIRIATSVVKGKSKRVGNKKQEIMQTEWKKAIVTLKKGEKIDLFESVAEK
jgi:large subunit ribosomal protein L23